MLSKQLIFLVAVGAVQLQAKAQVEMQILSKATADNTMAALATAINDTWGEENKTNHDTKFINLELAQHLYGGNPLRVQDYEEDIPAWSSAFTGGTIGSSSGEIVGVGKSFILKSESATFFANFQAIKASYYERQGATQSMLQKIRFIFKHQGKFWFVIENSNKLAKDRNEIRFDMKASRAIGKDSKFGGKKGALGFADDFFYMKQAQNWRFDPYHLNQQGKSRLQTILNTLEGDLKIFSDSWKTIQLVDFSILLFVNTKDTNVIQPANCVDFVRVNPATGTNERMEMCVTVIDFLADLGWGKNNFGQMKGKVKVYNSGDKFGESYANDLTILSKDIFGADMNIARMENIRKYYIPQARQRHQMYAVQFAMWYTKAMEKEFRPVELEEMVKSYYDVDTLNYGFTIENKPIKAGTFSAKCNNGLNRDVLENIFNILNQGALEHKNLKNYINRLNVDTAFISTDAGDWFKVQQKIAAAEPAKLVQYRERMEMAELEWKGVELEIRQARIKAFNDMGGDTTGMLPRNLTIPSQPNQRHAVRGQNQI